MEKLGRTLVAIAIGAIAVWIVFKAKEALAKPEPKVTPTERPVEPTLPKWDVSPEQICYRSGSAYACIPNPMGGLFKREDQLVLETSLVKAETSIS